MWHIETRETRVERKKPVKFIRTYSKRVKRAIKSVFTEHNRKYLYEVKNG